ncbi:glycogen debranching N-terminal domain-containing protein [Plantactinospora mayteni]|uniref:Amylo-alpha-1,6-glucosidase n=1 Tax=Plantactinospora mayteni TaxID=566021 RepID=A0ABQ4ELV5_9ACTN|nr:glycogen debranching N-terminal domain-containing protein [Plantactinospora mayteni]GIG95722.1 amylo-alpha-1,6-glucosidase [Plantactinospora mayteni]
MNDLVSILDGNTFMLSDSTGDVEPSPNYPSGLFAWDTRFLSRWVLTINGERLHELSIDDLQYFECRFFLVPGEPTHYVDAKTSVIRQRSLAGAFEEELTVLNHRDEPVVLTLRMEIDSDFADVFDARESRSLPGRTAKLVEPGRLRLCHERHRHVAETIVTSSEPAEIDADGLTFRIELGAHGRWSTTLRAIGTIQGAGGRDVRENLRGYQEAWPEKRRELREWLDQAPKLTCDSETLDDAYQRSLVDLAALQYIGLTSQVKLMATGLPWYMTLFGRHSLVTGFQTLPFIPQIARSALWVLALLQGGRVDDFRDEEPGKIMHEIRYGEPGGFGDSPYTTYYGAADCTPLFVVLLDEYERWTGDAETVRLLEYEARSALAWIDTYGNLMDDGYVWYERRSPSGLENQGWKDSWNSVTYADGRLPGNPRATCELQGYAYDAKVRGARLARTFWNDPAYADRLEQEAADLRDRFNRDFWIADQGYYALALDAEGGQVDALASNMGHLLWSGIVDDSRAEQVAEVLLDRHLFSGWGIRTLARDQAFYNPVGYHTGAIWPSDNSLIALGLRRYGFAEQAARLAVAMVEASGYFGGRMPEAFAGYDRRRTKYPVQYPRACSPHCSSAGTTLVLLRTLLGLRPHQDHLTIDPAIPERLGRIELVGIPGRWGRTDAFGRGRVHLEPE